MAPKVFMLVGLQCSGKSTLAKQLAQEYSATILNADTFRQLNLSWDNSTVFKAIYATMRGILVKGDNVVLDNTNITYKNRQSYFAAVKDIECETVGIILATPYDICRERLNGRNSNPEYKNKVPQEALEKYYRSFQIPFKEEGFSDIWIYDSDGKKIDFVVPFNHQNWVQTINMMDINQHTIYHKENMWAHCKCTAMEIVCEHNPVLFRAALFHDIGKIWTGFFKEGDENEHFYNHENVGTYFLLSSLDLGIIDVDTIQEILDVLFYVNYHMFPFNWNEEKAKEKWRKIFGEEKFNNLILLHNADIKRNYEAESEG